MALEAIVCVRLAMSVASGYGGYSLVGVHLTATVASGYGGYSLVGVHLTMTVDSGYGGFSLNCWCSFKCDCEYYSGYGARLNSVMHGVRLVECFT